MTTDDRLAEAQRWLDAYPTSATPARVIVKGLVVALADATDAKNAAIREQKAELVAVRTALEAAEAELGFAEAELIPVCQHATESNQHERMALLSVRSARAIAKSGAAGVTQAGGNDD